MNETVKCEAKRALYMWNARAIYFYTSPPGGGRATDDQYTAVPASRRQDTHAHLTHYLNGIR